MLSYALFTSANVFFSRQFSLVITRNPNLNVYLKMTDITSAKLWSSNEDSTILIRDTH